jgi:tetratricopeptide (TPR) repeat protein
MAKKRRLTKKELKEDKFAEATVHTLDYARSHLPYVIGGILLLVVVVIVVLGFMRSTTERRVRAETALSLANLSYMQGNFEGALAQYDEIILRYGRSLQGKRALYYRGSTQTLLGNYAAAIEDFRAFIQSNRKDEILGPAAQRGIGVCWENQGLDREAARSYEEVADSYPRALIAAASLLDAGRSYRRAGLDDEARRVYERIIDEYAGTDESEEARGELAYGEGAAVPKLVP